MKDSCPSCGYKFGLRGASFRLPDEKKRITGKRVYHCNNCGIELKREMLVVERIVSIIGYGALFIASTASLWKSATLSQLISEEWMALLYSMSIIGIGASIYFLLGRQHYRQIYSAQQGAPADAKKQRG
jgi:hypothetical protein